MRFIQITRFILKYVIFKRGNNKLPAESILLNVALNIIVAHVQFKFKTLLNVHYTRVRATLCVYFAIEQFRCLNTGNHVACATVDGYIVARR